MKQPKLKYHFYNPNSSEKSTDYILNILVAANKEKADRAIREFTEGLKMPMQKAD